MDKQKLLSVVLFMGLVAVAGYGQTSASPQNAELSNILARMSNNDLHTQKVAFDDLMTYVKSQTSTVPGTAAPRGPGESLRRFLIQHPEQADPIKLRLIALLNEENGYFIENGNPPSDRHEEDDIGEHYANLIDTVASLNDPRAIPALVGAMTTGGMTQRGILEYGDRALGLVLPELKNSDGLVRASALGMASAILEAKKDPASHAQMIALIESSLKDPAAVVRRHAVREIDCLQERKKFTSELQEIAKTDPDKLPGRADDGGDGGAFYPVRADARRTLRDIQNNTGCAAAPPKK